MNNDLIPENLSQNAEHNFNILKKLHSNNNFFHVENGKLACNTHSFENAIKQGEIDSVDGTASLKTEIITQLLKSKMPVDIKDTKTVSTVTNKLLRCDKIRADIEVYDEKILSDPNRGHWDLWEVAETSNKSEMMGKLKTPLLARNPILDVNYDGVIGIDFGTKSTVVVFQEDSEHSMPMRIGTGQLSKKIEPRHYENPTVLEFIDYTSFMKLYNEKEGRPDTLWEDLTTSHTAFESFINSNSVEYYSYLHELKQWMGDKSRQIRLRDKKGKDVILPPYMNGGEFDPIELYAYYIGLYINNMHNGIYLDYLLSYPVTYEKSVRDKMISSFERGIKKSLPQSILKDNDVMSKFRVITSASEPVAYAVCALEQYGFEPCDDKSVFYGVFDFGGGTTDFDFGLFREANRNERRYDYIMESFGAGGDKYLGGENILELLAYEVFKANQEKLRTDNITFVMPPECKRFLGSETLISESQEAKLNMAQLMEKLRSFWERREGYEKIFENNTLKVTLFNSVGEQKVNFELAVNSKELDEIIYKRIEKGVRNFFQCLIQAFNLPQDTDDIKMVNILLAGNSSKSATVKELFERYIKEYNAIISKTHSNEEEEEYFAIFPPLGTEEARAIQKERGINVSSENMECPTGKTGVAFGLVKSRLGGRIKLITEKRKDEEIKFMYYIGYEKKHKFKHITDREIEYNKWNAFIDASEEDFTIFYSALPEAINGELDIKDVSRKKCRLSVVDENANVYFRAIKPKVIEYVVAHEEGIQNENYLSPICKLEL
ncbi:MAG: hypothetical protein ACRCW1_04690 [Anaerotignaceae bacterium]